MADTFSEALRSWQNFYFMIGGASATLAGLMFVALSLGTHLIGDATRHLFNIFVTPSVIYFVSVLLLSAVMLIPAESPVILAAILLPAGWWGSPWRFIMRGISSVRQENIRILASPTGWHKWCCR